MLREKQLILLQHILTIGWKYNGFIHANSTFPQRKHVRRGEKKKKKKTHTEPYLFEPMGTGKDAA